MKQTKKQKEVREIMSVLPRIENRRDELIARAIEAFLSFEFTDIISGRKLKFVLERTNTSENPCKVLSFMVSDYKNPKKKTIWSLVETMGEVYYEPYDKMTVIFNEDFIKGTLVFFPRPDENFHSIIPEIVIFMKNKLISRISAFENAKVDG